MKHEEQQRIWDEEHKHPQVLLQMDAEKASSGVIRFYEFLRSKSLREGKGIEMGCGKGRNVIGLAKQGVAMYGFDFSPAAIAEAKQRAEKAGADTAHFQVMDATETWAFEDNTFDFGVDCFASTDIESLVGRRAAMKEFYRVLKPGGYLLAYLLSTDEEFHKEMIKWHSAEEPHAFYHATGKFEKVFDESEIRELYKDFNIIRMERVEKTAEFSGKEYACKHFWVILQKQ